MLLTTFSLLAATAQLAHAHFGVDYPPMRGNTLGAAAREANYSQWINPCAGVPGNLTDAPRTDWPLTGGSVVLDLRHSWTYLFINLGLGANAANFNYTLTDPFLNVTGNGTFCIPKLSLPADLPISDGSPASLQVVTVGDDGNALYNCADITFRESATELGDDECSTSEGMSSYEVVVGDRDDDGSQDDDDGNQDAQGDDDESKAAIAGVSSLGMAVAGIAALMVGFA